MKIKLTDFDVVFLSYDEPNAEKNYADLLGKIPYAKRVHGVKGSDAAHKACAEMSETDRLIIIDGDNIIDKNFILKEIDIDESVNIKKCVISCTAKNIINGLVYGNGGIKIWPKDIILNMKTHENADKDNLHAQVDFCWDINYYHLNDCVSEIHNNGSPKQAWRAGFREGVKMSLNQGIRQNKQEFLKSHWKNLHRLWVWLMVGADVENGIWAIYGAREGLFKTMCTNWDHIQVRDFDYLNSLWEDTYSKFSISEVNEEITKLQIKLSSELDIPIAEVLTPGQSAFFKTVYQSPLRNPYKAIALSEKEKPNEYDIVMITYNEKNANKNFNELKRRFPRAKRIDKIKGIHDAHIEAARIAETEMFWVVDGDAVVKDDFKFDYLVPKTELDFVHVWRCENPVNGLIYGYGGIKLLPREKTLMMDKSKPDMTTSISHKFKIIKEVSNYTEFNTDPFSSWRSAFRECVKLSSKIIDRQKSQETEERLEIWCTVGEDKPFGEYILMGAKEGKDYGEKHRGNTEELSKINDFDWLREYFNAKNS
jgi:hypothetical protein